LNCAVVNRRNIAPIVFISMNVLIVYDISDADSRMKISKYLESIGHRVQESVFECKFNHSEMDNVVGILQNLLILPGSIRFYPICRECFSKILYIGKNDKMGECGYIIC